MISWKWGLYALNGLLDVLILWQPVEVSLLFDLTKAYQQLRDRANPEEICVQRVSRKGMGDLCL